MARIALVGCADLPEPDPDEAPALEALRAAGHEARAIAWDAPEGDPTHDPADFDLCVLRATWNYIHHPGAFLAWVDRATAVSAVWNPPPVVRQNHHKRYLTRLAAAGVPTVPSLLVPRGARVRLDRLAAEGRWHDFGPGFTIKPAVGGWSRGVRTFPDDIEAAQRDLDLRIGERDLLVQPLVSAFAEGRERSIVWIDHEVTHVVAKQGRIEGEPEEVQLGGPASEAELALVERALGQSAPWLMYARIDVVPHPDGSPMLSELELIEPSLHFALYPPSLATFVRGVERRLR
jgi:hypothetical protein